MIKPLERVLKDRKIKYFKLIKTGSSLSSSTIREYLIGEYWGHYQAITGGEYVSGNAEQVRRQAIFIVNYNSKIDESYLIEDLQTGKIYNIKYIDNKEGYKGSDLKISVLETKEANEVHNE